VVARYVYPSTNHSPEFRNTAPTDILCKSESSIGLGFRHNIKITHTWHCCADECQFNLLFRLEAEVFKFYFQNYLNNIWTEPKLSIYEQGEVELGAGFSNTARCKLFLFDGTMMVSPTN
jgi:hypothetical protein